MKKLFALLLAIMMMATLSVTAFADVTNKSEGSYNVPISGTYTPGSSSGSTISVDIIWTEMNFAYTAASQGTWDPATHSYTGGTAGSWSATTGDITVKNHSNAAVTATFAWQQNTAVSGTITGTFTGDVTSNVMELESADAEQYRTAVEGVYPAPTKTAHFGISGDGITKNESNLGNVVVTIAEKSN